MDGDGDVICADHKKIRWQGEVFRSDSITRWRLLTGIGQGGIGDGARAHADAGSFSAVHINHRAIVQVGTGRNGVAGQVVAKVEFRPEIVRVTGYNIVGG